MSGTLFAHDDLNILRQTMARTPKTSFDKSAYETVKSYYEANFWHLRDLCQIHQEIKSYIELFKPHYDRLPATRPVAKVTDSQINRNLSIDNALNHVQTLILLVIGICGITSIVEHSYSLTYTAAALFAAYLMSMKIRVILYHRIEHLKEIKYHHHEYFESGQFKHNEYILRFLLSLLNSHIQQKSKDLNFLDEAHLRLFNRILRSSSQIHERPNSEVIQNAWMGLLNAA